MSVLIVDDSTFARMLNKTIVAELMPDETIREADNGEAAITAMREEASGIVFMDMNMPGIDGIEASTKILEEFPETRIAICTANVQTAIRDRAEGLGLAFLEKPMTPDAVKAFVAAE